MSMQIFILAIIIFLSVVGLILIIGERDKESSDIIKRVILDILLVVLGFSLGVVWDMFKDYRKDAKERDAIVTMLKMELAENNGVVNSNLKTIESNRKARENAKRTVTPLQLLKTDTWTGAKLRNNLFIKDTADLMKLVNLYSAINIMNEKIQFRENYRISNQAMTNYDDVLSVIDNDIEAGLKKTLPFLSNAESCLYRMHSLKVRGKSFTIEEGIVKEKEGK